MPSTFHGSINGAQKPGSKIRYNQDGSISGSASFSYLKGNLSADVIALGTVHPWDSAAFVSDREATWDESEGTLLCEYAGVWSSLVQKVEGLAASSVEPIDTNPNFPFGVSSSNIVYDDNGLFVGFKPGATSATPWPIGGVQSYYSPAGLTIRLNYSSTSDGAVTSALGNMGFTQNSLTAGSITLTGDNVILGTSVNWEEIFMSSISVYRITEEYVYNVNGWNPDIYT